MEREGLGVVAAMPQEIAPLLRRVKGYRRERVDGFHLYRFACGSVPVVLIESGMGPAHAGAATRALIRLAAPMVILNFGFAGGVAPGLRVGELVLAERVYTLEQGRVAEAPRPDAALGALLFDACRDARCTLRRGCFITAAGIMNKGALAGALGPDIRLPVLEMETAAVLREAEPAGIPVVALRGVSDAADEELGFCIEELCDPQLNISPARVAGCLARKPYLIPQLVRLAGNSKKAGRSLAIGVDLALQALAVRQTLGARG